MAIDAQAPVVANPSEAKALNTLNEQVHIFHKERLQVPAPFRCREKSQKKNPEIYVFINKFNTAMVEL